MIYRMNISTNKLTVESPGKPLIVILRELYYLVRNRIRFMNEFSNLLPTELSRETGLYFEGSEASFLFQALGYVGLFPNKW